MVYDIEKEKREAIEAGRRALNSLQAAKENLNSAKNWGLVDMFGGGFFTTMLKHSRIDQAKRNMEQAKYDLRNFSRELNDVNMVCNLNIDTGDFLSFADYFLMDLLWTGWSRIESIMQKTGRRSYSKNRKYRQSITAYVKEKAMSQKWSLLFVALWLILIFLFRHLRAQDSW